MCLDHAGLDGRILPPVPTGMAARVGYYVPKFTAKNHPELSTLYGLSGELNRQNVAANFLTPATWQYYCENISKSFNCSTPDSVAKGPPLNAKDRASYFHQENFTGFFYSPPEGNCTINPQCTGHFVNPPCTWATYGDSQMYWNDIPLTSRGPEKNNSGYGYSHMLQVWYAANATKNNVMIWWWFPDPTMEIFEGTDAGFHRIDWRKTTEKCLRRRYDIDADICSPNIDKRRGPDELSSCDSPVENTKKVFSKSLKDMNDNASEEERSPTFPFLSQFKIPAYAMDDIFRSWVKVNKDYYGYDSRKAVCKWVYDNLEIIEQHIPRSYPREIKRKRHDFFIALITITKHKKDEVMKIAKNK